MRQETRERIKDSIIQEYEMRQLNNKEAMLDYLEIYLSECFDIPLGIAEIKRDETQMSLTIFDRYICFDYPRNNIEVRYTPENEKELFVGSINFTESSPRPLWENIDKKRELFDIKHLDHFMERAFYSFTE